MRGQLERDIGLSRSEIVTSTQRACVKTPPLRNLGGRLTLGEVEKIAPSAIWRLDISSHSTRSGFSHGLQRLPSQSPSDPALCVDSTLRKLARVWVAVLTISGPVYVVAVRMDHGWACAIDRFRRRAIVLAVVAMLTWGRPVLVMVRPLFAMPPLVIAVALPLLFVLAAMLLAATGANFVLVRVCVSRRAKQDCGCRCADTCAESVAAFHRRPPISLGKANLGLRAVVCE